MASAAVQLSLVREAAASHTATNPAAQNTTQAQAQPNTSIEDTVTLTAQATQARPVQAQPIQQPPSPAAQPTAPVAQIQALKNPNAALNQTPAQGNGPQAQTQAPAANKGAAPAVPPNGAASPAAASRSASSAAQQQQQLAQLEAILQGLGIDPSTVSMSALTAMLPPDATDPAAILAYVQQFLGTAPPAVQQSGHVNVAV